MALSQEKRTEVERLITKHHLTMSANKLAEHCGVAKTTFRRICKQMGITCNSIQPNKINDPKITTYISTHWESESIAQIAKFFDVSETYINNKARQLGLPSKSEMCTKRRHDPLIFVALNRHRMTQDAMALALGVHKSEIKRLSIRINGEGMPDLSDTTYRSWKRRMLDNYKEMWSEQERIMYLTLA